MPGTSLRVDERHDLDVVEAGLRQRIDQLDLALGRDDALLELKAFARAFLADVDRRGQVAHLILSIALDADSARACQPHNAARGERADFGAGKPELGHDLRRVFTDDRRLADEPEIVIAHLDRQARQLGVRAAGKFNVEHPAAGVKLRVVKQVAGFGDRRERDIETIEQFGKVLASVLRHDRGDDRQHRRAFADAILVGLVGRMVQQVVAVRNARRNAAIARCW